MVSGMSLTSLTTRPFTLTKKTTTPSSSTLSTNSSPPPSLSISTSSTSSATSSSNNDHLETTLTPLQALELAKTSCPAFQNNECPFKNVQNEGELETTLAGMPPSHIMVHQQGRIRSLSTDSHHSIPSVRGGMEGLGEDVMASPNSITRSLLQHVKALTTTNPEDSNANDSCPFRSCAETMEGLSFSSLLAKLVLPTLQPPTESLPTTPTPIKPKGRKRSMSLSEQLKTGTSHSHASAESVHFVKEFIKGNIDRTLYSKLILNLYHVYTTLEPLLDIHGPTTFPTVHFPLELGRTETLKDDVDFFFGDEYLEQRIARGGGDVSPATKDYTNRLEYIARVEPLLLLSHAYTRYLGDLSGGAVLARVARKALNLQSAGGDGAEEDGLRFYHFKKIPSAKVFKEQYRTALDALPNLDADRIDRLVAEANVAFVLNMRIFEELDVLACIPGAEVRPLEEAVVYYTDCVELQEERRRRRREGGEWEEVVRREVKEAKCPFAILGGPNPHAEEGDGGVEEEGVEDVGVVVGKEVGGRCPWPFVFLHDPIMGMQDYQTWIVMALISCWIWNLQQGEILAV